MYDLHPAIRLPLKGLLLVGGTALAMLAMYCMFFAACWLGNVILSAVGWKGLGLMAAVPGAWIVLTFIGSWIDEG